MGEEKDKMKHEVYLIRVAEMVVSNKKGPIKISREFQGEFSMSSSVFIFNCVYFQHTEPAKLNPCKRREL